MGSATRPAIPDVLSRQDSNLHLLVLETSALPAELRPIEGYSPPAYVMTSHAVRAGFTQGGYPRPVRAYFHHQCRIPDLNRGLPHANGPMTGSLYQTELMRH